MQQLVGSQGDGWTHATEQVQRFYDDVEGSSLPQPPEPGFYTDLITEAPPEGVGALMGPSLAAAETLGRRTAEMHLALASDSSNLAFAPEPFTKEDLEAMCRGAAAEAQKALQSLESPSAPLPDDVASAAQRLLQSRDTLLERIRSAPALEFSASKIRVPRRLPPRAGAARRRRLLPARLRRGTSPLRSSSGGGNNRRSRMSPG